MSTALDRFLHTAPSLAPLRSRLERAARSRAPILILGEPGTGRTTLARALHADSARGDGPLIELDTGSIPTALFESELFGHTAGAFSGAHRARTGRVARAVGGTLLLDHIEELPIETQPKLLRLLSEGRYAPLGGRETGADVRFMTIAADDLAERIERRTFRSDLYYRLEVLSFHLPPLRATPEDLPPLIDAMIADLCRRYGRSTMALDPASERWMVDYSWPGNRRQVRNLLERSIVLHEGGALVVKAPHDPHEERPRSLAEAEEETIRKALAYARGHQQRAAELLGISRKTLWEKRRRLGIP